MNCQRRRCTGARRICSITDLVRYRYDDSLDRRDHGQRLKRRGGGAGGGTNSSSLSTPDFWTTTWARSSGEVTGMACGIVGVGAGEGLDAAFTGSALFGAGVGVFAGRAVFFFVRGFGVGLFFLPALRFVDVFAADFLALSFGRGEGDSCGSDPEARAFADALGFGVSSTPTCAWRTAARIAPDARAVASQRRKRTTGTDRNRGEVAINFAGVRSSWLEHFIPSQNRRFRPGPCSGRIGAC